MSVIWFMNIAKALNSRPHSPPFSPSTQKLSSRQSSSSLSPVIASRKLFYNLIVFSSFRPRKSFINGDEIAVGCKIAHTNNAKKRASNSWTQRVKTIATAEQNHQRDFVTLHYGLLVYRKCCELSDTDACRGWWSFALSSLLIYKAPTERFSSFTALRNVHLNVTSLNWISVSLGWVCRWCTRFDHVSNRCRHFIVSNWFIDISLMLLNSFEKRFRARDIKTSRVESQARKTKRVKFRGLFLVRNLNWETIFCVSVLCVAQKKTIIIDAIISSSEKSFCCVCGVWLWGQICVLCLCVNCDLWRWKTNFKNVLEWMTEKNAKSQTLCAWCDLLPVLD